MTVDKVLTALNLCGSDYYAGACKKCPFITECTPGENDALVDAAAEAITDLIAYNAYCLSNNAKLMEVLRSVKATVYIIVHRRRSNGDIWLLKTGLFRPNDLKKLGKTVFPTKAEAERELRRLRNGNK